MPNIRCFLHILFSRPLSSERKPLLLRRICQVIKPPRIFIRFNLLCCLFLIFVINGFAQNDADVDKVEVSSGLSVDTLELGGTAQLKLTFQYPDDGGKVRIIPPNLSLSKLKIKNVATSSKTIAEDDKTFKIRDYFYELEATASGEGIVNEFTVSYYLDEDPNPQVVRLPPLRVTVAPGPDEVPIWKKPILWIVSAMSLAFLFILFLIIKKITTKPPPPETPQQKALKRLDEIKSLLDQGKFSEVVSNLDQITRDFLKERFSEPEVLKLSASQLQQAQLFQSLSEDARKIVYNVFQLGEQARYSGGQFERHEIRNILDNVTNWLKK